MVCFHLSLSLPLHWCLHRAAPRSAKLTSLQNFLSLQNFCGDLSSPARLPCPSNGEGLSTAASAVGVRVGELEAATDELVAIVQNHPEQVKERLWVAHCCWKRREQTCNKKKKGEVGSSVTAATAPGPARAGISPSFRSPSRSMTASSSTTCCGVSKSIK